MVYLLIGILIGSLGIPIILDLKELISVFVELLKARLSIKIVECNAKIDKLNNSINKSVKAIGFTTTTSEEEEENYE